MVGPALLLICSLIGIALEAVSIGLVVPVVGTIVEPSFITTLPIFGLFLDDLPFSKDYGLQVFLSLALLMVFAVKAIFSGLACMVSK